MIRYLKIMSTNRLLCIFQEQVNKNMNYKKDFHYQSGAINLRFKKSHFQNKTL